VELTAPTTALVIGFPLLMMLVMLAMNTVERRLTSPGRAPLRLVPGGAGDDAPGDDGGPGEPGDAPEPADAAEAKVAATAGAGDSPGGATVPEFRPALQLVKSTHSARNASAADARS
jgi:hypothetical protein